MGNFRQHVTLSSAVGAVYAWASFTLAGIHWLYGAVAALLATVGGMLPDIDHPVGTELKGFSGILGVLAAVAVWQHMGRGHPDFPFELHLLAVVLTFVFVRHGLRRILSKIMVHRGVSHSMPTCAVWGAATYLYYPSEIPLVRILMALGVILGFFSHLLLDEICSVDLKGRRVNKAFGTAIKFWAPSPWATMGIYALLSYLVYVIIDRWPDEATLFERVPAPHLPAPLSEDVPQVPPVDAEGPGRPTLKPPRIVSPRPRGS